MDWDEAKRLHEAQKAERKASDDAAVAEIEARRAAAQRTLDAGERLRETLGEYAASYSRLASTEGMPTRMKSESTSPAFHVEWDGVPGRSLEFAPNVWGDLDAGPTIGHFDLRAGTLAGGRVFGIRFLPDGSHGIRATAGIIPPMTGGSTFGGQEIQVRHKGIPIDQGIFDSLMNHLRFGRNDEVFALLTRA